MKNIGDQYRTLLVSYFKDHEGARFRVEDARFPDLKGQTLSPERHVDGYALEGFGGTGGFRFFIDNQGRFFQLSTDRTTATPVTTTPPQRDWVASDWSQNAKPTTPTKSTAPPAWRTYALWGGVVVTGVVMGSWVRGDMKKRERTQRYKQHVLRGRGF